ncbi:tyrosine-type recombinase/integrase [Sulfurivermis fontis]|uniref:tyrosine-type recombinase/integrase n=1 Tax=Sulfurivermis fontis TaxID=1972068 RepID=UPI00155932D2|nr:site-specific integrase [Sulfurivermis fontis]
MQAAEKLQFTAMEHLLQSYLLENLVRPATARTYEQAVRRWTEETGMSCIEAITRDDVLKWRNDILSRARPETWNKYRRHLRALFNYAVSRGWLGTNIFSAVPPARAGTRLKKTVDVDVVRKALVFLDDEDESLRPGWFWAMVVRAIYFTGVRRRQIVELRWGDVNLDAGTWRIRAETCKTHREWFLPLVPQVVEDLTELYRRTCERLKGKPGKHYQVYNVSLFYPRYKGPELKEDQIGGFFHRLSEALEEPITSHRLRHTMATMLAVHGDIRTLQEILGHTNLSTTMVYVHPDVERMRSLMARLPNL